MSRSSFLVSSGLMLRPSLATRILTLHAIPKPLALRNFNVLSPLVRRTPPTPHRTRRSVATAVTETAGPQHSILIHAPVLKDIEDSDYDADLIPPEEAKLGISQRAAEQLQAISQREKNPEAALRVTIESGGCHGYQYKMELSKCPLPDDYVFSHSTIKPSNIVVDAVSMSLLKGSTIDFVTEMIGSSFRVVENPQSKGSGCGCGVSWELKL
ncbi:hypothetical protein BJ322DRAFT_1112753 [Thelephora terrestris]|uniref:Core domain-containing protein n=1 Tax=Thelephora terrestris TaxID=56493 RepID=A0A9P6L2R5_9AGAM|nr:hypothetical protein BJ322DRAFT_1112753 [Thelephora terrestris]